VNHTTFLQDLGIDWIQPGKGLVQDDQVGIGNYRDDELKLLAHITQKPVSSGDQSALQDITTQKYSPHFMAAICCDKCTNLLGWF